MDQNRSVQKCQDALIDPFQHTRGHLLKVFFMTFPLFNVANMDTRIEIAAGKLKEHLDLHVF